MRPKPIQSQYLRWGRVSLEIKSALIASLTGADKTMIAAVAGFRIGVVSAFLNMDGAGDVAFQSDAVDLTGPMGIPANGNISLGWNPNLWLLTVVGEALKVSTTANNLSGWVRYVEVPA